MAKDFVYWYSTAVDSFLAVCRACRNPRAYDTEEAAVGSETLHKSCYIEVDTL